MKESSSPADRSRRNFLLTAGAVTAAAGTAPGSAEAAEEKLPQVRFGKHSISRLICGTNPFGALSHLSPMIDFEFRMYYTPEQIVTLALDAGFADARYVETAELAEPYLAGRSDDVRPSSGEAILMART